MGPVLRRILAPAALLTLTLTLPLPAQQGAVVFHHFRSYPAGQWTTETQPYRNGQPFGAPITSTACSAPMSTARKAAIVNLGNAVATPACKTTVLHDEERTAEYEQVCTIGPNQQTTHSTMHSVDDHTITIEMHSTLAGHEVAGSHSTSHYLGACPAGQSAPEKPSPEDCAELATSRHETEEALKSCAEQPENQRATCVARVQAGLKIVQLLQQSCAQ